MSGYKDVDESIPDRIVTMAEEQQKSQIDYKDRVLSYSARDNLIVLVSGLFLALFTLIFAGWIAYVGREILASVLIGSVFGAGGLFAYLRGRSSS